MRVRVERPVHLCHIGLVTERQKLAVDLAANRSVKQVEVANKVTLVLYDNGQLVASGSNLYGAMQLKYNSVENVEVELPMLNNEKITQICSLLDVDIDL